MNAFLVIAAFAFMTERVLGGYYHCPQRDIRQCYVRNNKCCSDDDCPRGKICCDENCGNTCYWPQRQQQDGIRVCDSEECQIGVVGTDYCPTKSNNVCIRSINRCCSDYDCNRGEICCQENCGNTCHTAVKKKTSGERVFYDRSCTIDEY